MTSATTTSATAAIAAAASELEAHAAMMLAEFHGDVAARGYHPFMRVLRIAGRLSGVAFAAVWLAVVMIEGFVELLARGGMLAVEMVCAVLDWVGADY